jgi:hypothetical protein
MIAGGPATESTAEASNKQDCYASESDVTIKEACPAACIP